METERHDVIVIGGGAAGVSAALECFDIKLDVVLLEAGPSLGGQLDKVPNSIRNLAPGRFESGPALHQAIARTASILGDRIRLDQPVTRADLTHMTVDTPARRFQAGALVVASGSRRRDHPAAVDGAFGGDVTYLMETDPERFAGRAVAVFGGGDSAALDTLELAEAGSRVVLVHRSAELKVRRDLQAKLRAEPRIEDLAGWDLDSVAGGERLETVVITRPGTGERRTLSVGGLVVKIGRIPNTEPFRDQLDLDERGAVVVDERLRTSRPGVMAAGDVVAGVYPRVAVALGQGQAAARSVLEHLTPEK